jgi:hypothetical protein
MWYCYCLFDILQENGEDLVLTSIGTVRMVFIRPVQTLPNHTESHTAEARNLQEKSQAYGPYRFGTVRTAQIRLDLF